MWHMIGRDIVNTTCMRKTEQCFDTCSTWLVHCTCIVFLALIYITAFTELFIVNKAHDGCWTLENDSKISSFIADWILYIHPPVESDILKFLCSGVSILIGFGIDIASDVIRVLHRCQNTNYALIGKFQVTKMILATI
jgi:hypothetical protein